jgi:hypothetical protein
MLLLNYLKANTDGPEQHPMFYWNIFESTGDEEFRNEAMQNKPALQGLEPTTTHRAYLAF